jgi:hypothetical protein
MTAAENNHVNWLVEQSMLHAARPRQLYSGQGRLWQAALPQTRPRDASALSSVWFTAYPASIVTREGGTVLEALGDEALWQALSKIGIQGIHNGPLKNPVASQAPRTRRPSTATLTASASRSTRSWAPRRSCRR